MKVEYIMHMGDDLMVVDAARVSFNKKSSLEPYYEDGKSHDSSGEKYPDGWKLSGRDTKLINSLARDGHWSPFSHPQIQVRVTAPVFIANQLKRSVVGLSINEVSRRYVDDEPTFYIPDKWRGRPPGSIKQGSSDEEIEDPGVELDLGLGLVNYETILAILTEYYNRMLKAGIAPEMARMVLPQSMNTSWIWTGSLLAFIRIYKQRIDSHSQLESQMIAKQLGEILERYFPVSFEAWTTES